MNEESCLSRDDVLEVLLFCLLGGASAIAVAAAEEPTTEEAATEDPATETPAAGTTLLPPPLSGNEECSDWVEALPYDVLSLDRDCKACLPVRGSTTVSSRSGGGRRATIVSSRSS